MATKVTGHHQIVAEKGSILLAGMGLMMFGISKLMTVTNHYDMVVPIVCVLLGAAIVYWREKLKINSRWHPTKKQEKLKILHNKTGRWKF